MNRTNPKVDFFFSKGKKIPDFRSVDFLPLDFCKRSNLQIGLGGYSMD